jgi:hypothetical protein
LGRLDSDKTLLPISTDAVSGRRSSSVIGMGSVGSEEREAHRASEEPSFEADVRYGGTNVNTVDHLNNLPPAPVQPSRLREFRSTPSASLAYNSSHLAFVGIAHHGGGAQTAPPPSFPLPPNPTPRYRYEEFYQRGYGRM